jgi:hypothetical protein
LPPIDEGVADLVLDGLLHGMADAAGGLRALVAHLLAALHAVEDLAAICWPSASRSA